MSEKKYWQNFGEVNEPENLHRLSQDEFLEELPFEGFDDKGLIDAKAPRRDFLKYLGFSTAAATLAASCKIPVRKAIPYANKPENLVPGVAKYYATTFPSFTFLILIKMFLEFDLMTFGMLRLAAFFIIPYSPYLLLNR